MKLNVLNWSHASAQSLIDDRHAKSVEIARPLKGYGFNTVRFDPLFNEACAFQAGNLNPIYTRVDEALERIWEAGYREIFVVFEAYVPETTHWMSFNGGVGWPHGKRPPEAVVQAFKSELADFLNYIIAKWVSLGGLASRVNLVPENESCVGAAGFGDADGIKAFLEGLGYTGYWDSSALWSGTWAAQLTANGFADHVTNFGYHDRMQVLIPYLFEHVHPDAKFWMPAFANEDIEHEFLTYLADGFDWYEEDRWFDEYGRRRQTFNKYHGRDQSHMLEVENGAAYNISEAVESARILVIDFYADREELVVAVNTETGVCIDFLDQDYSRRVGFAQIGRIHMQYFRRSKKLGRQFSIYTICGSEAIGDASWSYLSPTGQPHVGLRVVLEGVGIEGATSPNGQTYTNSANEPSTPVGAGSSPD